MKSRLVPTHPWSTKRVTSPPQSWVYALSPSWVALTDSRDDEGLWVSKI